MTDKDKPYTATEKKLLAILSDGMPHRRDELLSVLPDELGSFGNVRKHLTQIRKRLRPRGEDVLCEYYKRSYYYRHVRLLKSSNE